MAPWSIFLYICFMGIFPNWVFMCIMLLKWRITTLVLWRRLNKYLKASRKRETVLITKSYWDIPRLVLDTAGLQAFYLFFLFHFLSTSLCQRHLLVLFKGSFFFRLNQVLCLSMFQSNVVYKRLKTIPLFISEVNGVQLSKNIWNRFKVPIRVKLIVV